MMECMSKFDYSDLDGRLLRLLLAVVEEGSVTGAAARLGVTQSAVSHMLDKLRTITADPLFVKSGRGIVATARAEALALQARELLASLQGFAMAGSFDPSRWQTVFTIAANDFQRDVLLPPLAARLRQRAPGMVLRIIPSGVPTLDMLRNEHCQLVISPRPPDGTDIVQKRLFEDAYRVFYDPTQRDAPATMEDYLSAEHITVVYEPRRALDIDQWMEAQQIVRRFSIMVPAFSGLLSFVRGSQLLATAPGMLQATSLRGLESVPVPLPCPPIPMYLIWHRRYQLDPAHLWLRGELEAVARLRPDPAQ
jgi:DNA-binding transcriptional LysR family regulator